jgi:hypothetical protein
MSGIFLTVYKIKLTLKKRQNNWLWHSKQTTEIEEKPAKIIL